MAGSGDETTPSKLDACVAINEKEAPMGIKANSTDATDTRTRAGLWSRVFAGVYNVLLANTERRGNRERRARLLADADGVVVELGAGTGHNLRHYPAGTDLVLTEPEGPMFNRLQHRIEQSERTARALQAPAERLPLPDDYADTVVSTLVLCTVDDVPATLTSWSRTSSSSTSRC